MTPFLAGEARSQKQVAASIDVVRDILGESALAAYLYGSAVAGGVRPGSDVDVLIVSRRALGGQERAAIVERLLQISGRSSTDGVGRPIELTILARPALVPWRYPPRLELQYGEWMRSKIEQGELPEWPHTDPDVAVLIEIARRASVPLIGQPATSVLEPVPWVDVVRAMVEAVPVLMPGIEQGDDIRNGLLTLARIWMSLATGEIRSKDEAARWALSRLPEEHRPVLAHASAAYLGEEPEDWRNFRARLRPHVDHVVTQIRRLESRA